MKSFFSLTLLCTLYLFSVFVQLSYIYTVTTIMLSFQGMAIGHFVLHFALNILTLKVCSMRDICKFVTVEEIVKCCCKTGEKKL